MLSPVICIEGPLRTTSSVRRLPLTACTSSLYVARGPLSWADPQTWVGSENAWTAKNNYRPMSALCKPLMLMTQRNESIAIYNCGNIITVFAYESSFPAVLKLVNSEK